MLSGVSEIIAGPFSVELIVLQTCSDENIVSKRTKSLVNKREKQTSSAVQRNKKTFSVSTLNFGCTNIEKNLIVMANLTKLLSSFVLIELLVFTHCRQPKH